MKLSVFTTMSNPAHRGDNYIDALDCYKELADEVVIVDGSGDMPDGTVADNNQGDKIVYHTWPDEFSWEFIGQQFQRGYEACTGDWVLFADLDFIYHEDTFDKIRKMCELHPDSPALSFWKYQFILPDRYNIKSRRVVLINKAVYGDRIKFNGGGDLCLPTLDGKDLTPDDVPSAKVPIYNYEKILKTKEQIAKDQGRMERAWHRHFGEYQMRSDGTDEGAYAKWIEAQRGKFKKPQQTIPLESHPKYVQETIRGLQPDQFGYNGFNMIEGKVYD